MIKKNFKNYFVCTLLMCGIQVVSAQLPPGDWSLVWEDNFDGSTLDATKWGFRTENYRATRHHDGNTIYWRWENDNVSVANSKLVLKNTRITTSVDTVLAAAISSMNLFESTYGYYEARIKIAPTADGCHTAFWLQSRTTGSVGDGGSDGAEIDVLESAFLTNRYNTAVHWDGYGEYHQSWGTRVEANVHDGAYHTYGLEWSPDYYKFYFDGQLKSTYTEIGVSNSLEYIILSTGASWGEGNAHKGSFPNHAYVDYVKVYKDSSIITVIEKNIKDKQFETIYVYPNPSTDILNVRYTPTEKSEVTIMIYDFYGREKLQHVSKVLSGNNIIQLKLDNEFDNGMYILLLQDGVKHTTKKVLIKE